MTTNITPAHREAFEALTSGRHNNFALFSCFVDSEPAATIVAVTRHGEDYTITLLFVSVNAPAKVGRFNPAYGAGGAAATCSLQRPSRVMRRADPYPVIRISPSTETLPFPAPRLPQPGRARFAAAGVEPSRRPARAAPARIGWQSSQGSTHLTTIRTTLTLRKHEARRLMNRGYEIMHIETHHRESGDESWIVWTRPAQTADIPESELPY